MKVCKTCKKNKSLSKFFKSSNNKGGYRTECKICSNVRNTGRQKLRLSLMTDAERDEYYQKNRERSQIYTRLPRAKIKKNIYMKEYSQTFNGRYTEYKRTTQKTGREFSLSKEEFATFWQKPCTYCNDPIETIGLDRIDNLIGYRFDNVTSCCKICNFMKADLSLINFIDHVTLINKIFNQT